MELFSICHLLLDFLFKMSTNLIYCRPMQIQINTMINCYNLIYAYVNIIHKKCENNITTFQFHGCCFQECCTTRWTSLNRTDWKNSLLWKLFLFFVSWTNEKLSSFIETVKYHRSTHKVIGCKYKCFKIFVILYHKCARTWIFLLFV